MTSLLFSEADHEWMEQALVLAETAATQGEVPVGAVLVLDNQIIGTGFNSPIHDCDTTAHAEIKALRAGSKKMNNYRLVHATLYVTLEPCLMCAGALTHARVQRVIFGASDAKAGAMESILQMTVANKLNHRVDYYGGLLAERCGILLKNFFRDRRI